MNMRVFYEEVVNGQTLLRNATTTDSVAPLLVKMKALGKPFWAWPSIPGGRVIGCDFDGAPLGTADLDQNETLIQGITTKPEDVLIYAPTT